MLKLIPIGAHLNAQLSLLCKANLFLHWFINLWTTLPSSPHPHSLREHEAFDKGPIEISSTEPPNITIPKGYEWVFFHGNWTLILSINLDKFVSQITHIPIPALSLSNYDDPLNVELIDWEDNDLQHPLMMIMLMRS